MSKLVPVTNSNLEHVIVNQFEVSARAGAHIYHCIRESVQLAMQTENIVVLTHNAKRYVVDPEPIILAIESTHQPKDET